MIMDDALPLDDALWQRLLELTEGDAALCFQCGECTAACPWGLVREGGLPVRTLLRKAQLGIDQIESELWLCTTCGQCQVTCPRGVDIPGVFRALRQVAWEQHHVEKGLPSMLWSMYWNNNPWSQPPSQRSAWSEGLELEPFDPQKHEILLYIGCTSSYDRRARKIAHALVSVLKKAGVAFGYLGNEEPCCGEAALSTGQQMYFEEVAANTSGIFLNKGVNRLVTISPHCYDVFKNHYPSLNPDFEPLHYTQYLAELVDQGRLVFEKPLNRKLTFQDPCYLGRLHGEYEAPRRILAAIPGLDLLEMKDSREQGLCCGGGGGRMWLETPAEERFAELRVQQAAETGATHLLTACPFCLAYLEDSATSIPGSTLTVLDIAEVAAEAIRGEHE
ncbi:MAG TPA: heterodisulfide reductase-related iron-sulfur binding cluster [Anaerolineaceae bacterium]|nr:heterodisulfide reductase-related iron-sulfur binding cluster [Anaerolineaceae bacterium]